MTAISILKTRPLKIPREEAIEVATAGLTFKLAYDAGQDAGNRSMYKNKRTVWNEDDWSCALKATNLLLNLFDPIRYSIQKDEK
jgi:hypothetical protein